MSADQLQGAPTPTSSTEGLIVGAIALVVGLAMLFLRRRFFWLYTSFGSSPDETRRQLATVMSWAFPIAVVLWGVAVVIYEVVQIV